jgi:hypothetical protein
MWTLVIIIPGTIVLYLLLRKRMTSTVKITTQASRLGNNDLETANLHIHIRAVVSAILIGLLGFVVFFAFGSVSGRGEIGVAATFIFYLLGGLSLTKKYTACKWYGGVVINIPIWIVFKFWAETGQFEIYFWGLVAFLISSYAGMFLGLWILKRKIELNRTTKVLLISSPFLLIVLTAYILNLPKTIPSDKNMFVGLWKSATGFELRIMSNGTVTITQNINDRASDYENLAIKVGPSFISSANVEFRGDSMLSVVRFGYYAREYKIDQYPTKQGNHMMMMLNGVILVKE